VMPYIFFWVHSYDYTKHLSEGRRFDLNHREILNSCRVHQYRYCCWQGTVCFRSSLVSSLFHKRMKDCQ